MGLKVAIVGFAPSRDAAPWADLSWEMWGLAWDPDRYRLQRTFEMHEVSLLKQYPPKPDYFRELEELPRLYMADGDVKGAEIYPFDAVAKTIGGAYFCSSIAYALALAIHEQADEIGIWGVDMTDDYGYQRPNTEYLIGLARGKGVKVHIPDSSPLCKYVDCPSFAYDGRYGKAL